MLDLLLGVDFVLFAEPLEDLDIEAFFHDEVALPRGIGKAASVIDRLQERQVVHASALVVVFSESRSGVDDSGTVFCAYIVHAGDVECFLIRCHERHELLIFHILQRFAGDFFDNFILLTFQHLRCQILADPEEIAFFRTFQDAALDVLDVRADGQGDVGRNGPRGRRPCQEVFVVSICHLEFACDGVDFDILIPLSYLM